MNTAVAIGMACMAMAGAAMAQSAPPPSMNVFLADLDLAKASIQNPRNISQGTGYNNQPAFLGNDSVLFVSDRSGSTDVYRYDMASKAIRQVTDTPAAEFSPTPLADGSGFTVTRVADPKATGEVYTDSQQLWRYSVEGKAMTSMIPNGRVGYHSWLDAGHVALFIVGNEELKQPHTLVLADVPSGKTTLLSTAPGRTLSRTPDGQRIAFVDKSDPAHWSLSAMAAKDAKPSVLVALPPAMDGEKDSDRGEDYCWLPDGSLLMAKGKQFLRWDGKAGSALQAFASLPELKGAIKRIAASPDGKHLAFVVQ